MTQTLVQSSHTPDPHATAPAAQAQAVAVRVAALILQGREFCLIRRREPGRGEQFS